MFIWQTISAHSGHTCGLTTTGQAYCWGRNSYGQLGNKTFESRRLFPVKVEQGNLKFNQIVGGDNHTCALTIDGQAYCWGDNTNGHLGHGPGPKAWSPTMVTQYHLKFIQVAGGSFHTCGLTGDGQAYCWGWNDANRLGRPTDYNNINLNYIPTAVIQNDIKFISISSRDGNTCGLTVDGQAYCWGKNKSSLPTLIKTNINFRQLATGGNHTCALTIDGQAYCWTGNSTPTLVHTNLHFEKIVAGGNHTCALTIDGQVYCWTNKSTITLTTTDTSLHFKQITISGYNSTNSIIFCGLTTTGQAYCWGRNDSGQLGDGTTDQKLIPTPVTSPF